jgi:hypothetical protein
MDLVDELNMKERLLNSEVPVKIHVNRKEIPLSNNGTNIDKYNQIVLYSNKSRKKHTITVEEIK